MTRKQFELLGGEPCLDFVNTVHDFGAQDPEEELINYGDLVAFARQTELLNAGEAAALSRTAAADPRGAQMALQGARRLREALYRILLAAAKSQRPRAADLDLLNRQIESVFPHLRINSAGGRLGWAWEKDASDLNRVLWPVLRSATELLTSSRVGLLRECESETCTWMFLDGSKNHTRRWCDMKRCGNREKWRRHYRKARNRALRSSAGRGLDEHPKT